MDNVNYKTRWEILDRMLGHENPVKAEDIFNEWKRNGVIPKNDNKNLSLSKQYSLLLRQDLFKFNELFERSIPSMPSNMCLIERCVDKNDSRKRTYKYSVTGFSLMPIIRDKYSKSDWSKFDAIMNRLSEELPVSMAEKIQFYVLSRLDVIRGRDAIVEWPERTDSLGAEMLPSLFNYISNKEAVSISFGLFGEEPQTFILHPYLLKEYNGRWYCFGYREDEEALWPIALDRVVPGSIHKSDHPYRKYEGEVLNGRITYFDNVFGVTKAYNNKTSKMYYVSKDECEIVLGVHTQRQWNYLTSNKIHNSQVIKQELQNSYGQISLRVITNIEMYQNIIALGPGITIESPSFVREEIKNMIDDMAHYYNLTDNSNY